MTILLFWRLVLLNLIGRGDESLAVERIPIAGHLRAVWILDDDTINGEENFCCFANGEISAEGCISDIFNL